MNGTQQVEGPTVDLAELLDDAQTKAAVTGFVAIAGCRHAWHQQLGGWLKPMAVIVHADDQRILAAPSANQDRRQAVLKGVIDEIVETPFQRKRVQPHDPPFGIQLNVVTVVAVNHLA
jgi:hypothetical protein